MNNKYLDHKGIEYESFKAMCEAHGQVPCTVKYRLSKGYSLGEALTLPQMRLTKGQSYNPGKESVDHKGNKYVSFKDMCDAYGKEVSVVRCRLKRGVSLKDALEGKFVNTIKTMDHKGNAYDSFEEMCKTYGMSSACVRERLKKGMPLEQALEQKLFERAGRPKKTSTYGKTYSSKEKTVWQPRVKDIFPNGDENIDPYGNHYVSFNAMCNHYGLRPSLVLKRMGRGLTLAQALGLTEDVKFKKYTNHECTDPWGNKFRTFIDMCIAHNKKPEITRIRLNSGWTLEEALIGKKVYSDSEGRIFDSYEIMCDVNNVSPAQISYDVKNGKEISEALDERRTRNEFFQKCSENSDNNLPFAGAPMIAMNPSREKVFVKDNNYGIVIGDEYKTLKGFPFRVIEMQEKANFLVQFRDGKTAVKTADNIRRGKIAYPGFGTRNGVYFNTDMRLVIASEDESLFKCECLECGKKWFGNPESAEEHSKVCTPAATNRESYKTFFEETKIVAIPMPKKEFDAHKEYAEAHGQKISCTRAKVQFIPA